MSTSTLPLDGIIFPDGSRQRTASSGLGYFVPEPPLVMFDAGILNNYSTVKSNSIIYDKLLNSVGGGFSTVTGSFTAPVAGYYFLEMGLYFDASGQGNMFSPQGSLAVNPTNTTVVFGNCLLQLETQTAQVNVATILKLSVGDVVRGQFTALNNYAYNLKNYPPYSFFKGILLSE